MNLKFSGLIFVLIVMVDAISGSTNTTDVRLTKDLPVESAASASPGPENAVAEPTMKTNSNEANSKETRKAISTKTTTSTTTEARTTNTTTTTTTTVAPTLAPTTPPSPAPAPEKGPWVVRDNTTNLICIISQMAMQLNITYPDTQKVPKTAVINVPKNATVNGSCSEPSQVMTIKWGPGHTLNINFSKNKTLNDFYVSGLALDVNATVLKNATVDGDQMFHFKNSSSEFQTPLHMSYKCSKEQDLILTSDKTNLSAVLSLKDTQFQAFMNKSETEFAAAQDCDSFDTPDIVPIAVGCALAILVLVVLAAYLIGRRRSQNRGYLSIFSGFDEIPFL